MERKVLVPLGLPPHVQQHIATMARLHREDRYNRAPTTSRGSPAQPAQTVEQYVAAHADVFS